MTQWFRSTDFCERFIFCTKCDHVTRRKAQTLSRLNRIGEQNRRRVNIQDRHFYVKKSSNEALPTGQNITYEFKGKTQTTRLYTDCIKQVKRAKRHDLTRHTHAHIIHTMIFHRSMIEREKENVFTKYHHALKR